MERVTDFIFLGSKITADGDWSHEIKRCLLLGRKAMTNLDSVLKSRDITLPTKVCIVKTTVFPVVTYRCESWTVRLSAKELMLFFLISWRLITLQYCSGFCHTVVLEKTLESPFDSKEIKPVNPIKSRLIQEINPEYSLVGLTLKLKLQNFVCLTMKNRLTGKDLDAWNDWRQEEKGTREGEMTGWQHWLSGHEFEQTLGDSEGCGSLKCCSPWGGKQSDTTVQLKNNCKFWPIPQHSLSYESGVYKTRLA